MKLPDVSSYGSATKCPVLTYGMAYGMLLGFFRGFFVLGQDPSDKPTRTRLRHRPSSLCFSLSQAGSLSVSLSVFVCVSVWL
eukprot:2566266-Rhodomonas_salina.1